MTNFGCNLIVKAVANYGCGLIVASRRYKIVGEGFDYYHVKLHGNVLCIPKWAFDEEDDTYANSFYSS